PLDGQIIQRQARPGNGVSTLNVTPLFLFAPDVGRIVRAELEEQYIPGIKTGGPAEIILEADPARRWRGKVLRVGRWVLDFGDKLWFGESTMGETGHEVQS
ncbi:HlyD family efflux transporter periplasmic adaptor subunit, partial [Variovorax sp. 2RAF20]